MDYSYIGKENQKNFSEKCENFYLWIFKEIKPYIRGDILEIGAGLGNFSEILVKNYNDNKIILSDVDKTYLSILSDKFKDNENIKIEFLDLNSPGEFKEKDYKIDTCIAINILEHIKDDVSAITGIYDILNRNGSLILLLPTYKFLYNIIDKKIEHYRRYTKKEIIQKVENTGFKIEKIFYFNFVAIFGWIFNGSILKKSIINKNILSLYNKLIPLFKFIDRYLLFRKIGISLIVILNK
ncbi:MAG: class I SAM-dependent methyltransferase [Actinomycetota bacterium]